MSRRQLATAVLVVLVPALSTADLYMADATLLPIAEPPIVGREAIRQEWAKTFGIDAPPPAHQESTVHGGSARPGG